MKVRFCLQNFINFEWTYSISKVSCWNWTHTKTILQWDNKIIVLFCLSKVTWPINYPLKFDLLICIWQIAAIVFSRQNRVPFDTSRLDNLFEKIVLETTAERIMPLVVNPGRILLTSDRLYFQPFNNVENVSLTKFLLRINTIDDVTQDKVTRLINTFSYFHFHIVILNLYLTS